MRNDFVRLERDVPGNGGSHVGIGKHDKTVSAIAGNVPHLVTSHKELADELVVEPPAPAGGQLTERTARNQTWRFVRLLHASHLLSIQDPVKTPDPSRIFTK